MPTVELTESRSIRFVRMVTWAGILGATLCFWTVAAWLALVYLRP